MTETPKLLTRLTSTQRRIFPSGLPTEEFRTVSALRNEPVSFCLAYRADHRVVGDGKIPDLPISVSAVCEEKPLPLSAYRVGYVPYGTAPCEDAETADGSCPDPLYRRSPDPVIVRGDEHLPYYEQGERNLLNVSCVSNGCVLFTVNEAGEPLDAGDYELRVRVRSLSTGEELASHTLTLHIVNALLPENDLIYTNWFHYDCFADLYGLALYSNEYFSMLEDYLRNATLHGMTALLIPAFTPALDTPVGGERTNVQLIRVIEQNGDYSFDFSLLRSFLELAQRCGIRYFEHCPLFSQWGAKSAINVYGERDGSRVRLFGWEDAADSPAYTRFLRRYLTEFLTLAKELGISERLLFHISDEPCETHEETYRRALAVVSDLLEGYTRGDALSDFRYYQNGLVSFPIVSTKFADDFDGRCDALMLYYTGGPTEQLSNRLLSNAPWRTRILGLHLYRYRAKGFLHWGYNYYYGRMSHGLFDPTSNPCGYRNLPGASYLVYPGPDRKPLPSLREKLMMDALSDCRALRLLETLIGREATLALCAEVLGEAITIRTLPTSAEQMLALRERINQAIEQAVSS